MVKLKKHNWVNRIIVGRLNIILTKLGYAGTKPEYLMNIQREYQGTFTTAQLDSLINFASQWSAKELKTIKFDLAGICNNY